MEKTTFQQRLLHASRDCANYARTRVVEVLPESYLYKIYPNKHGEAKRLVGDAEVFPEDTLPPGQFIGPVDADGVVNYLWRNGKVPEWINAHVESADEQNTILLLWCCGHFTSLPANTFWMTVDPNFDERTPFAAPILLHQKGGTRKTASSL